MENKYFITCKYCNIEFQSNHLNRKYCTESCKRAAFRDKNIDKRENIKAENNILSKNSRILAELHRTKETITTDLLKERGFDLNYFNRLLDFGNSKIYILEKKYHLLITKEKIQIIKQINHVS